MPTQELITAPPGKTREPTPRTVAAMEDFARLESYFDSLRALATALDWDDNTAAAWRDDLVRRPRRGNIRRVRLLLALCLEVAPYLPGAHDVGQWVNAPLPELRGGTPASLLRARRERGLRELVQRLTEVMPKADDSPGEFDEREFETAVRESLDDDSAARFDRILASLH